MKMLFCRCRMCKLGRHRYKWDFVAKRKGGRRKQNVLIKLEKFDELPEVIYLTYMD